MIKEHIKTFAELYLESEYNITDAKLRNYVCKSLGFGYAEVDMKDVRLALAELCKENKIREVLVINDLAIYDKIIIRS
jgi:hypothetical protein